MGAGVPERVRIWRLGGGVVSTSRSDTSERLPRVRRRALPSGTTGGLGWSGLVSVRWRCQPSVTFVLQRRGCRATSQCAGFAPRQPALTVGRCSARSREGPPPHPAGQLQPCLCRRTLSWPLTVSALSSQATPPHRPDRRETIIGPDRAGQLLELIVVPGDTEHRLIHSMGLRPSTRAQFV